MSEQIVGRRRGPLRRAFLPALALAGTLVAGCSGAGSKMASAVGNPQAGARLVDYEACGSCHLIPGKAAGIGLVGPPLGGVAKRSVIAGVLPNTPADLARWIRTPQEVLPGNAMPDMGLTERQARDIAAYLYTLQ